MEISAQFIVGPTAAGKSAVAHFLAAKHRRTLVSSDAMYVYRGMDLGTAKPSSEERSERNYLGVDIVNPSDSFNLAAYVNHVREGLTSGDSVMVCGGTGLYVKTLLMGLEGKPTDSNPEQRAAYEALYSSAGIQALQSELKKKNPEAFKNLADPENPRRIIRALEQLDEAGLVDASWKDQPLPEITGLTMPRDVLHRRIEERAEQMFANGLINEVRGLLVQYGELSATAKQAIGYAECLQVLNGDMSEADALERTMIRTRQLVKKQMTWFRHQLKVDWIEWDGTESIDTLSKRIEENWKKHGDGIIRL